LRLRQWKQTNRPNEVEKPLTEEEEAELMELTVRFHRFGSHDKKFDEMARMWEEAAAEQIDRDRGKRPRPNELLA
jgi:hypothetical protein